MDIKARNRRYLLIDVAAFGVLSGVVGTFLSIFTLRLGGSSQDIGLLSSLPALVTLLFLVPAGRFLERYTNILRPTVIIGVLQRLQYLLVALVVLLPLIARVPVLILIIAMGAITTATGSVAFTVVFGLVVPHTERPRLVSTRNVLASLSSGLASIAGGRFLGMNILPFPWSYSALFVAGFLFSMISLVAISRLSVPPHGRAGLGPTAIPSLRALLGVARRTPRFQRFTIGAFIANCGLSLPLPLYALYYVRVLNMSDYWIGLITTVGALVPILSYPIWGRMAGRLGNSRLMVIGCLGVSLFPLTTALSSRPELLLIPAVIGGVFSPAWALGVFNGLYEVIPAGEQATFISVNTAVLNLAAFAAPLISTVILVPLVGIVSALYVGAVARLLGALVMYIVTRSL